MDELQVLREALPEPQGPSPEVVATGRRMLSSNRAATRSGTPRSHRGAWVGGLVAATVATIVLVAAVGRGGPVNRRPLAEPMTPKQVLLAAATISERLPSTTGRYWHAEIRGLPEPTTVEHDGIRYRLDMYVDQTNTWIARSPADLSWYLQGSSPTFTAPTPADDAAWRHDGSPTLFVTPKLTGSVCVKSCSPLSSGGPTGLRPWPAGKAAPKGWGLTTDRRIPGLYVKGPRSIFLGESRHKVSVADVMAFPTDPAQLRARLEGLIDPAGMNSFGRTKVEAMYDAVRDLLILAPAPPKVRAAAFRLLSTLPGMKVLGKVRDPLGREGIGLIVTNPSFRPGGSYQSRFIIDPTTSKILAVGTQNAPGNHNAYTPVITDGWTNATPTPPAQSEQDIQP